MEDSLLQYQMRKLDESVEELRDTLETCLPEDLRHIQGQLCAKREMRDVMHKQYQNWLRGEEDADPYPTSLERMLDLEPTADGS